MLWWTPKVLVGRWYEQALGLHALIQNPVIHQEARRAGRRVVQVWKESGDGKGGCSHILPISNAWKLYRELGTTQWKYIGLWRVWDKAGLDPSRLVGRLLVLNTRWGNNCSFHSRKPLVAFLAHWTNFEMSSYSKRDGYSIWPALHTV